MTEDIKLTTAVTKNEVKILPRRGGKREAAIQELSKKIVADMNAEFGRVTYMLQPTEPQGSMTLAKIMELRQSLPPELVILSYSIVRPRKPHDGD